MTPVPSLTGVSIRWSLLRSFLLLVLVLAGAIFALLRITADRTARTLAGDLVRRTVDRMESDLAFFFEPVRDGLRVAEGWADNGALRCGDAKCINTLFAPVIRRHYQIDAVNSGDARGRSVLLAQTPTGWRNRLVDAEAWGTRARMIELDAGFREVSSLEEDIGYDPRTRPWYRRAVEGTPGRVQWTEPYRFFTSGEPGITASLVMNKDTEDRFVLSFDVRLDSITDFVRRLDTGPGGLVFVLSPDVENRDSEENVILGLPRHAAFASEEARRKATLAKIGDLDLPVLKAAREEGRRLWANAPQRDDRGAFSFPFEYEGETWWGTLRPFSRPGAPTLLLGVVAPESDFLQDLSNLRLQIGLLTLLAVAGSMFVAGWLSRKYSRPVHELVRKSDRIRDLDLEPLPAAQTNVKELKTLDRAQEDMRRALDSFSRYVPTEVVRDLLARGEAAEIGGREETLTILFTDIVGFTSIAERLSATELTLHMSEYFDIMVGALREGGATVDKFVGDAIVAFWGAPSADAQHAAHGVDTILRCQQQLIEANAAWAAAGKPPLPTRFGLATGPVVVGNVGARTRLHYTVLGDIVNLASRLEGANRMYGTESLVAESTVRAAGDAFVFRRVDRLVVKGRQEVVTVYELLGRRGEVEEDAPRRVVFEEALTLYQQRAFAEALGLLRPCVDGDGAAACLAERCRAALASPPADDWDGSTRLTTK